MNQQNSHVVHFSTATVALALVFALTFGADATSAQRTIKSDGELTKESREQGFQVISAGFDVRTRKLDRDALATIVARFSQLLEDLPELVEIEINPLTVGPSGAVAVDARARLSR